MDISRKQAQKIADFYGDLWKPNHDIDEHSSNKDHLDEFRKRTGFPALNGLTAVDLGCGIGRTAIAMAELGAQVTALDLSEENLSYVQHNSEKSGKKITIIKGDVLDLPFNDESFDFVWCNGVIHHTLDPIKAFREAARIVKKGGYLFIGVYSKGLNSGLKFKVLRFAGKILPLGICKKIVALKYPAGSKKWHDILNLMCTPSSQYRFSRRELASLYEKGGFEPMKIMNEHMNPVLPKMSVYRLKLELYYLINGGRTSTWYDAIARKA